MNRYVMLVGVLLLGLLAFVLLRARHPAPAAPAEAASTVAEQPGLTGKPIHELRLRDVSGASEYLVRNLVQGPIEVRCELQHALNVRTDPPLPRTLVVPAGAEQYVAEIKVADPTQSRAGGEIACRAMLGDPRARPLAPVRYALPLPPGTKYTLEQGFGGAYSHNDEQNRFALDFGVPEGTPVVAARGGIVMQVEEDFRAHGTDARYGDRANYVRVLHEDGSMALYAHLAPASMLRRPGDRIVVGQLVGKSGNTGLSTGPHLHFAVQHNAGMKLESMPFAVEGVDPHAARH